jgi:hypothetical protein
LVASVAWPLVTVVAKSPTRPSSRDAVAASAHDRLAQGGHFSAIRHTGSGPWEQADMHFAVGLATMPRATSAGASPYPWFERDFARELNTEASSGDGKETFVARPTNMSARIVNHATSNSQHLCPWRADVGAAW